MRNHLVFPRAAVVGSRKRDKVQYEPSIEISEEVAYAVEEYLVNAGFEPMGVGELDDVPYLDEVVDDMRSFRTYAV